MSPTTTPHHHPPISITFFTPVAPPYILPPIKQHLAALSIRSLPPPTTHPMCLLLLSSWSVDCGRGREGERGAGRPLFSLGGAALVRCRHGFYGCALLVLRRPLSLSLLALQQKHPHPTSLPPACVRRSFHLQKASLLYHTLINFHNKVRGENNTRECNPSPLPFPRSESAFVASSSLPAALPHTVCATPPPAAINV